MVLQELPPSRDQFTEPGSVKPLDIYVHWWQKWGRAGPFCLSDGFLPLTGL